MGEDRVRDELQAIQEAVEDLTGLRSRWSGNVLLLAPPEIVALKGVLVFAEKRWACDRAGEHRHRQLPIALANVHT